MRLLRTLLRRSPTEPPRPPRVPEGETVYAVGDIHGRADLLDRMLDLVQRDIDAHGHKGTARLVFLGDYVDRGPDSRAVIERLAGLSIAGCETCFLLGNHDFVMADFLAHAEVGAAWLEFGGDATLMSYGVGVVGRGIDRLEAARIALLKGLPEHHRAFLASLQPSLTVGDYFFVHAGIVPGVPLDRQSREDMLWIRDGFIDDDRWHGRVVVHGHTITETPVLRPNRIAIDTGAYHSGRLTCLVLEGEGRRFIQT